ncbi:hypothetical protein FEM48_Zijuj09G0143100 [Ziziphus jujuba var. spinosa]|uniref:Uncharacterized protein n=1 Tax=Ziziphus jujuba var. spinosa TaxID=714518 RepID=A0A978UTG8_ZIZJJ|nr:hypothetical protein FEM48_Zijuj09G0143100 [Ziziphus jujuba var. spinosa]
MMIMIMIPESSTGHGFGAREMMEMATQDGEKGREGKLVGTGYLGARMVAACWNSGRCHALKVLDSRNFTCIPEQYIRKRWTKGAKKGIVGSYDLSDSSNKEKKSAESLHLSELMH